MHQETVDSMMHNATELDVSFTRVDLKNLFNFPEEEKIMEGVNLKSLRMEFAGVSQTEPKDVSLEKT